MVDEPQGRPERQEDEQPVPNAVEHRLPRYTSALGHFSGKRARSGPDTLSAMPAEPLHPIPDPLSREDVLLLQRIAAEQEPYPDEQCLAWCERALEGDAEALSFLREQLVLARQDEVEDRRAEIWSQNTAPAMLLP